MKNVYTCRLARLISPMRSLWIYCKRFLRFLSGSDRLCCSPFWKSIAASHSLAGDRVTVSLHILYTANQETEGSQDVFDGLWCSDEKTHLLLTLWTDWKASTAMTSLPCACFSFNSVVTRTDVEVESIFSRLVRVSDSFIEFWRDKNLFFVGIFGVTILGGGTLSFVWGLGVSDLFYGLVSNHFLDWVNLEWNISL